MILKNFGRFLVAIWSVITDHLETIYRPMILKNFDRFLVAIWSVITNHLETVYRPNLNGRKIVGNGLSVNGR